MSTLEIVTAIVAIVGGVKALEYIWDKIIGAYKKTEKWDNYEDKDTEIEAKLQQIQAEQCMLTYCIQATLDGLHQLGCNGKVTEARRDLDEFLNKQAHDVK